MAALPSGTLAALLAAIALTPAPALAGKFKCPAFTKLTSDPYIFKDPEQCDKYWTCVKGESKRSLCPDGLVFHPEKPDGEDPCDLKANVPDKCKSRPNLQRPKPGDAHCPRQYGVYPSSIPGECDTYYTCTNGKSAPTKCAEGLHYSDDSGICVWARDSGRDDCDAAPAEPKRKKKKGGAPVEEKKPDRKPAEKLSNGFVCPGGPEGVHPALPHPDDCRLYYVCLNGVDPSDAGCPPGKVFNPTIQQCDLPANVNGCEDYYNPAAKKKKEELASSLGADLKSDEFSMFLKLLKNSGVLKGNLLNPEKSAATGLSGKLGGRQGGGRASRPGQGRPGPRRPGLGRPRGLHGGRPRKGGRLRGPGGRRQRPLRPRIPSYDYYDYEYDYDFEEAQPAASPETPAESRSFAQSPDARRPRPPSPLQSPLSKPASTVRVTPIKSTAEEEATRRGDGVADTSRPSGRAGLFAIPANRKNIFTSKFIPKVKMVGDTENLAPVPTLATLPPTQHLGPEQPARSPVLPEKGLSADDANTLFGALFPGLMATEPPTVVHPGLPEAVMLEVPTIKQSSVPAPIPVREHEAAEPRSRNSLFQQRRPKPRPESRKPAAVEEVKVALQAEEEPVRKAPVASSKSTGPRTRNSLFNRRQKPGRPVERVEPGIRNLLTTTEPADPTPALSRSEERKEDRIAEVSEETPRQNLFSPRARFRPRSRPTSVREPTTASTTLVTTAPNPSTPKKVTSTSQVLSSVATSQPFEPTTALPISKRKGFRSFLKSRSRSPANGGRQSPAGGPRLPKPEPRISGAGNRSPPPAVPAPLLPLPPTPALPGPRPVHQTAHLLDLAMTDFLPTPPPTSAPRTKAPEMTIPTNQPVSTQRKTVTTPPQTPTVSFPRISQTSQTDSPSIAAISRPQAVVPAFLQPAGSRSTSFPQQAAPRARQLITDVPTLDSNMAAIPTSVLPLTQSFTTVQTSSRSRGSPRHPSSSPQTDLARSSRGRAEESLENKHKVVMAARSQLKPFLPKAENEGDALEKLRAKIESLQSLNRHRGRG